MASLLLRCKAPMQSWGVEAAFEKRTTATEPSKSGVIGLLCAALGRDRDKPVDDLAALRMAVRVDAPGELFYDYQTTLNVARAGGGTQTQLSERYYLADAAFVVGLEGDKALLTQINAHLLNPVWPLFLGRKSYLPSSPIAFAESELANNPMDLELEAAMQQAPFLGPKQNNDTDKDLRLLMECSPTTKNAMQRRDQPVCYAHYKRKNTLRFVASKALTISIEGGCNVL